MTATLTYAANQDVLAVIDPRRPARPATYVAPADRDGYHVVSVRNRRTGDEQLHTVKDDRITPAAPVDDPEVDTPATDDVPVVDVAREPVLDGIAAVYREAAQEANAAAEAAPGDASLIVPAHADPNDDPEYLAYLAEVQAEMDAEGPVASGESDTRGTEPGAAAHTRDECEDLDGCEAEHLPAPAPKAAKVREGKKAALPEGFVTLVGLAKEINARGLYTGSSSKGFTSQMLYAIVAKDDTFPGAEVAGRANVVELEAGITWWEARRERVAQRGQGGGRKAVRKVVAADVAAQLREALTAEDLNAAVWALVYALEG